MYRIERLISLCGNVLLPFVHQHGYYGKITSSNSYHRFSLLLFFGIFGYFMIFTWHVTQFAWKLSISRSVTKAFSFYWFSRYANPKKGSRCCSFGCCHCCCRVCFLLVYSLCRSHKIWLKVIYCNFLFRKLTHSMENTFTLIFLPVHIVRVYMRVCVWVVAVVVCGACRNSHKSPIVSCTYSLCTHKRKH